MRLMTGWLSQKSIIVQGIPSLVYSSWSSLKTCWKQQKQRAGETCRHTPGGAEGSYQVELLLQHFVSIVDTKLFEAVDVEHFKPGKNQETFQ